MYQLRIYTLQTAAALEDYVTVHWPRHISSLRAFDVITHGIWTEHDTEAHRLVALISYPNGADPIEVTNASMASPGFAQTWTASKSQTCSRSGDIGGAVRRLGETAAPRPLRQSAFAESGQAPAPACS
jgi:hypothetical protein